MHIHRYGRELTILLVSKQGNLPMTSETWGLSFSIHLCLPLLVFSMSCFRSAWFLPPLRPFLYSVWYCSLLKGKNEYTRCLIFLIVELFPIIMYGGSYPLRWWLEIFVGNSSATNNGSLFSSVGWSLLKFLNEFLWDIVQEPCRQHKYPMDVSTQGSSDRRPIFVGWGFSNDQTTANLYLWFLKATNIGQGFSWKRGSRPKIYCSLSSFSDGMQLLQHARVVSVWKPSRDSGFTRLLHSCMTKPYTMADTEEKKEECSRPRLNFIHCCISNPVM